MLDLFIFGKTPNGRSFILIWIITLSCILLLSHLPSVTLSHEQCRGQTSVEDMAYSVK
jgi:hypothetical protein